MKNYLIYLPLLALLAWGACKPCDDPTDPECPNYCVDPANPRCPNYDPCWDQLEVKADFEMAEVLGEVMLEDILYIETDTALQGNSVRFRAVQAADRYEWYIGSDPRVFDKREFSLYFLNPTQLWITLIVQRAPSTACYPGDDGIDTVRKWLVIVPLEHPALIGTYRGATTAKPGEVYDLSFFRRSFYEDSTQFSHISVTGLHPGCNNIFRYDNLRGHAGFRAYVTANRGLDPTSGCLADWLFALLKRSRDSIEVRFQMREPVPPYSLSSDTLIFKGKRIP